MVQIKELYRFFSGWKKTINSEDEKEFPASDSSEYLVNSSSETLDAVYSFISEINLSTIQLSHYTALLSHNY